MGYRIIVTDDEPVIRADLCQTLEDWGMEVAGEATDGFDAVELSRQFHPDVVLMDISMPLFDGLDAARTILDENLAGTVVIISAYYDQKLIARAGEIGVGAYLVKPIEERNLLPAIEIAVAAGKKKAAAQQKIAETEQILHERSVIDRAKALIARDNGIPEAEAYRMLQKLAMDKRRSMGALAESIVEQNHQHVVVGKAKKYLMEKRGLSEKEAFRLLQTEAEKRQISLSDAAAAVLENAL